jgi:hypothetical protein
MADAAIVFVEVVAVDAVVSVAAVVSVLFSSPPPHEEKRNTPAIQIVEKIFNCFTV